MIRVRTLAALCASLFASEVMCEYAQEHALRDLLPEAQHAAVDFLIEHMPERDRGLSPEFLAEHVDYAYRARERFPWAKALSDELFLNNVLPYASLNERRDAWL